MIHGTSALALAVLVSVFAARAVRAQTPRVELNWMSIVRSEMKIAEERTRMAAYFTRLPQATFHPLSGRPTAQYAYTRTPQGVGMDAIRKARDAAPVDALRALSGR